MIRRNLMCLFVICAALCFSVPAQENKTSGHTLNAGDPGNSGNASKSGNPTDACGPGDN